MKTFKLIAIATLLIFYGCSKDESPAPVPGQTQGTSGDQGTTGDAGPDGEKGDTGSDGEKGDTGDTGQKGDTGDTGAKGDTGATGPKGDKGDTGDTGPKGDKGDKGTANVMYSKWMNFNWNSVNTPKLKQMKISVPEITDDFTSKGGIVLVYLKKSDNNGTVIVQLPFNYTNSYLYSFVAIVKEGLYANFERGIIINNQSIDNVNPAATLKDVPGGDNFDLRYILIPGGLPLGSQNIGEKAKMAEAKYDYESIKQLYNILD